MKDYIVRAIAADSQIRAFAAVTTETVETARKDHNTSPVATAALGRLLTAGAMMGTMMKGDKDILTLQIKAGGPLEGITVTADWMIATTIHKQESVTIITDLLIKIKHSTAFETHPLTKSIPVVLDHRIIKNGNILNTT